MCNFDTESQGGSSLIFIENEEVEFRAVTKVSKVPHDSANGPRLAASYQAPYSKDIPVPELIN